MYRQAGFRFISYLAAFAVLIAACGGGDDELADGDDSPRTTTTGAATTRDATTTTERSEATTTTAEPSGPDLICQDPAPTEVGLGTPLDSNLDSQQCFWVDVPSGSSSVTVAISGLSAEVRLGVYYGYIWNVQFPGAAAYWTADRQAGATEVTIEDPQPGPYFFYLSKSRNAVSDFTVEVTTQPAATAQPTGGAIAGFDACGGPATILASGDTVEGRIASRNDVNDGGGHHEYYCIEVADGGGTMTIDLTDAEGYFDIQVAPPDFDGAFMYQNDRTLPDKSLTIDDVKAGAYYIDVGPALGTAVGSFEITVTLG